MAGKRAKRERRKRGPAEPPSIVPEVAVLETETLPPPRALGLGGVVAIGAAAAAVLAGGLYLSVDSGSGPGDTTPAPDESAGVSPEPARASELQVPSEPASPGPVSPDSGADEQVSSAAGSAPSPSSAPSPPLSDDFNARIQILQQQIRLRPDDGVNRSLLASLLDAQGNIDEAAEHYRRAVEDAPNYARGRHDYGIFLVQRRGRVDQARGHLQAAVDLAPDSAQIHVGLGFVHGESGDMTAAMREFNRALELDPSHVEAHFYLANALDEIGRLEESAEQYRTVSRLQPGYYAAHYGLGAVLAKQGDLDGALEQFRLTMISPSAELRRLAEQAIGYLEEERGAQEMARRQAETPGGVSPEPPPDAPSVPPVLE